MDRRSFLQVMGLAVAAPSFLVSEKSSSPKRENPDFITTGFPTIDDALGGGFKRGTYNVVCGFENQPYQTNLLLKSIAIKAASDLQQRSSVLLISTPQSYQSNKATPFDGLLTTTQFLDWDSIGNYDLVIINCHKKEDWKENTFLARTLSLIAHECNMVVVQNVVAVQRGFLTQHQVPIISYSRLLAGSSMYSATTALVIENHSHNMNYRLPELRIIKNRYGHTDVSIDLIRPSIHFFEEA